MTLAFLCAGHGEVAPHRTMTPMTDDDPPASPSEGTRGGLVASLALCWQVALPQSAWAFSSAARWLVYRLGQAYPELAKMPGRQAERRLRLYERLAWRPFQPWYNTGLGLFGLGLVAPGVDEIWQAVFDHHILVGWSVWVSVYIWVIGVAIMWTMCRIVGRRVRRSLGAALAFEKATGRLAKCLSCGYDLSHGRSATCPECGAAALSSLWPGPPSGAGSPAGAGPLSAVRSAPCATTPGPASTDRQPASAPAEARDPRTGSPGRRLPAFLPCVGRHEP